MASIPLIDQADIHKSCKALEALVSALVAYTDTVNSLANIQKKLSKALKEAASVKGTYYIPSNALTVTAGIFEALSEVDVKFGKIADRESENIGNGLRKWFKKLAKEEKAHDERMTSGNAKIKQAGQAYEKKAKRKDRDAADEHNRYVGILNTVGPELAQDRYNHSLFVTQRHTAALSDLAGSLARLAEMEWGRACEHVRRCAPSVGELGQCRALCEGGWSGVLPGDLPNLNDQTDKEPERKQMTVSDRPATHTPPIPSDVDSPVNKSVRSKPPSYTPSVSGAPSGPDTLSPPPVSPITKRRETTPQTSTEDLASTQHMRNVQASSRDNLPDQPTLQSITKLDIEGSAKKNVSVETPKLNVADLNMDEDTANPSPVSQDPPRVPPQRMIPSVGERQPVSDAETADQHSGRPRYIESPESSKMPVADNASETGTLDRRTSAESSKSGGSLVANMRERYDTRPTNPPSSPPPRDLPRTTQRVLDLATRYTPLDSPSPTLRSDGSLSVQTGFTGDRFMTFQERHSHNNNHNRYGARERDPPEQFKQDYFDEREEPRPHYNTMVPAQSRKPFLRDDRNDDRYHSTRAKQRTPERQYADEFGTRDRRRFDPMEELTLQEREANLREQERQLEIERVRLANARDGGYTSDSARSRGGNSPYRDRKLSESPHMSSQHSLLPPQNISPDDHSPSCGCQRCSAQHYASPTSGRTHRDSGATQTPVYKPDPPIQLRPEKPKGWLRRMSMPVASIVSSNENKSSTLPGVSNPQGTYIDLPTEDGRLRRRSFEGEQARASGRYTSTERRRS
ncbi:hypothetical protein BU17DRAFT_83355 [Hysterangium stoloniferum]|nr:hypothetical protein BU17DRAFT_83355 [Hysterangium stoloniferum]